MLMENPVFVLSFPAIAELTHLGYLHKRDAPQTHSGFPTGSPGSPADPERRGQQDGAVLGQAWQKSMRQDTL